MRGVPIRRLVRAVSLGTPPIKGTVAAEPGPGLWPGYSASGQDVWLEGAYAPFRGPALVVSAVGARCGKVFLASGRWGVTANTAVLAPRQGVDPRYLWHLVNDEDFWVRGVTAQPYVQMDASLDRRVHAPSLAEQRRIADFLDDQVSRLDSAVAEVRSMRILAGEAAASRLESVLGAHAHASLPLGRVLQHSPSYGVLKPDSSSAPGAVPLLRVMDVDDRGRVDVDGAMRISAEQSIEYSRTRLKRGDVVLSVVGTLGRAAVVDETMASANISRALCRLVLRPGIEPALIQAQFRTEAFRRFCDDVTRATAQAVLNMGDLVRFRVVAPADPTDSATLVDAVATVDAWRQAAENDTARFLRLLQERKRALITACVTGEFDVLTASARAGDAALGHLPAGVGASPKSCALQ